MFMSDTIGDRLKQAREGRGLTIEQVANATRIRGHYLQALERNDLSVLPSAAQARGFLRIYAGHLGLDVDELLAAARPLAPAEPAADLSPASPPTPAVPPQPRPGFLTALRERFLRPARSEPQKESQREVPAPLLEPTPMVEPEPATEPASGRRKKARASASEKPAKAGTTARKSARGKQPKDEAGDEAAAAADEKKKMS